MNNSRKQLSFLVATADKFPLFRSDLTVLFGKEMARRGHAMQWLLHSEKTCLKSYNTEWAGGQVRVGCMDARPNLAAKLRKQVCTFLLDLDIARYLFTRRYDFVQVKDKFISALIALAICRIKGMKMVFWLSYPFPESYLYEHSTGNAAYPLLYLLKGHFLRFLLYRVIMPFSDRNMVQSEQMKRDVAAMGVDENTITVVPMGIDRDKVLAIDDEQGEKQSPPSIIFTGVFFKIRRLDFVIRVFNLVKKEIPKARLCMVGAGRNKEEESDVHNEIDRLGLRDCIELPGFVPFEEMLDHVRRADLCLSPYYPSFLLNSTSPTKLIEYMAMGKAVVANDHPEQRLVIEQSGGGLCVPYDEEAFTAAVVELLNDPERCRQMGRKGRAYVLANRTYSVLADRVEKVYLDVVGR